LKLENVTRFTAPKKHDDITPQGLGRSLLGSPLFHTPYKLLGVLQLPLRCHDAAR